METMPKCVRWSTITVYEFGVGLGGSAIPKHGGPSVGLAKKPKYIWETTVNEVDPYETEWEYEVSKCDKDKKDVNVFIKDSKNKIKKRFKSRRRRVRWLKPCERVTMLTRAGLSEKRIYRYLMESSEIAMSRRLTLAMNYHVRVK